MYYLAENNMVLELLRIAQLHTPCLLPQYPWISTFFMRASVLVERMCLQEEILRGHLGSFGLPQDLAEKPMYQLSGGQKNRVVFAKVRLAVVWT